MRAQSPSATVRSGVPVQVFGSILALLLASCSSDDTPKAWNALATCLLGKDAGAAIAVRVQKLRLIQLGNADATAKDAWPKRCNAYADDLFATLPSSGDNALLRSKLREKLNCTETKGSCSLPSDATLSSTTIALWDAAKSGGLTTEVAANVAAPAAAPDPLLDSKSWKSLSSKPVRMSGPVQTPDGRGLLVLKPTEEGKSRPHACEFTDHFSKVRCFDAASSVPEFPSHTIEIVNDAKGVFAAGLVENGMVAYDLASGEKSDVRGPSRRLIRDGVVVEKAAKDEISQEPPPGLPGQGPKGGKGKGKAKAKPPKGKPPAAKEEGFNAVELNAGKAAKDLKLPIKATVGEPLGVGNQIVYLSPTESGAELGTKSLTHGRLKDGPTLKGSFAGSLHSCRSGSDFAVGVWGPRSGQNNAKPTAAEGKTQFTATLFQNNAWSKPVEATLPFDRSFESDLVCGKASASIAWARSAEGGAQVGRIDCTAEGCKTTDVKLPGVESKWWWGVGPLGDKTFVLWRSSLGETRLRIAPLAELATAKDILVFDTSDFGGPTAGEVSALFANDSALLVFRGEQPVAVRLGADGSLHVIAPG